jgi:hypothetical protein
LQHIHQIDLGLDTRDTGLSYHPQTLIAATHPPSRIVTCAPTPVYPRSPGSLFSLANKVHVAIPTPVGASTSIGIHAPISNGIASDDTALPPNAGSHKNSMSDEYDNNSSNNSMNNMTTQSDPPNNININVNGSVEELNALASSPDIGLPLAVANSLAAALGPSATVSVSQTLRARSRSISIARQRRASIPPSNSDGTVTFGADTFTPPPLLDTDTNATTNTSSNSSTNVGISVSGLSSAKSSNQLPQLLATVGEDRPLLHTSLPALIIPVGDNLEVTAPIVLPLLPNASLREPQGRELYFRNAIAMAVTSSYCPFFLTLISIERADTY